MPIDYNKTIIYKLVCKDLTIKELYVGATTNWYNRQHNHKSDCNNEKSKKNLKVYRFIRANCGFDNWSMIMVEEYPCENKLQSDTREHYWTDFLGATLNSQVQRRTPKKYQEDNKEKIAEYNKKIYEDNKNQIAEQKHIYYEKNKGQITKKLKIYNEKHKEKIAEYKKIHYEANRLVILEKQKIKYTCECGSINMICNKLRHNKSIKHINYLSTL